MGFNLEMFTKYSNQSLMAAAPSNGVFSLKPGEIKIHEVDLSTVYSLNGDGDISIQGIAEQDLTVEIYYSNWNEPFNPNTGLNVLDPYLIQEGAEFYGLWFKHTVDFSFPAQEAKHYSVSLPITRFVKFVVRNTHTEPVVAAFHMLIV